MKNNKIFCLIYLVIFLFVFNPPKVFAATVLNPVSGNNNEDQINAALQKGGTVHLNAGTYIISKTINLQSNTVLEGDTKAIIKLVDNAKWAKLTPMIKGKSVSNIRITGFEIDGNREANRYPYEGTTGSDACGHEYYDMLWFEGASNVEVDHMYLHSNWNDLILFKSSSSKGNFHDNVFREPGHDVIANYHATGPVYVTNNCMRTYCNSGVRAYTTTPVYLINNSIARETGYSGGYAAMEIEGDPTGIWDCNNTIGDIKTKTAILEGGQSSDYHTGGCPIAPTRAPLVDSCTFTGGSGTTSDLSLTGTPASSAVATPTIMEITPTIYCIGSCLTSAPSPTDSLSSSVTTSTTGNAPTSLLGFLLQLIMILLRFIGLGN